MRIFLRDHDLSPGGNPKTAWWQSLSAVFDLTHDGATASDTLLADEESPKLSSDAGVVFLHPGNGLVEAAWIAWFRKSDSPPNVHLVLVSKAGNITTDPTWPKRVHGCYWKPGQFLRDSENQCIPEFIGDLDKGVFSPELLQPRTVPEPILAYTLAIYYKLQFGDMQMLRGSADRAYEEMLVFARAVARRKSEYEKSEIENLLPSRKTFDASSPSTDEATGRRFQSMRQMIEVLRADA